MATKNIYQIDSYDKLWCKCDGTTTSFVDSSTGQVAKSITANGNATQLPIKLNKSAGFFNGTTDYVALADHADFDFATDLTIETFLCFNGGLSSTTRQAIYSKQAASGGGEGLGVEYLNGTGMVLYLNAAAAAKTWAWTPVINTWYHLMVVRVSGVFHCYINGVEIGTSFSNSDAVSATSVVLKIGADKDATPTFNGWMKEYRVSKVARTATVPTAQYSSDANTVLLMHFDTPATSPLAPAIAFDGTGDYLTVAYHADWDIGTGDATVEGFMMMSTVNNYQYLFSRKGALDLYYDNASKLLTWNFGGGGDSASFTAVANKWYHFCMQRKSADNPDVTLFIDGRNVNSKDNALSVSSSDPVTIGAYDSGASHLLTGYIKELRVSKIARYSNTGFTPSQSGFTVDSDTILYIKGDENNGVGGNLSTDIKDSETTPKVVTCNGDTKIKYTEDYRSCIFKDETGKFPYPVGSAKVDFFAIGSGVGYFDGASGSNLDSPSSADFDFGTDPFTLECYIRFPSIINANMAILSKYTASGWVWRTDPDSSSKDLTMVIDANVVYVIGEQVIANVWYHYAVAFGSTKMRFYLNGTIQGTEQNAAYTFNGQASTKLNIGSYGDTNFRFTGLMDNIRISKGVARYLTTFNPPQFSTRNFGGFIAFI